MKLKINEFPWPIGIDFLDRKKTFVASGGQATTPSGYAVGHPVIDISTIIITLWKSNVAIEFLYTGRMIYRWGMFQHARFD